MSNFWISFHLHMFGLTGGFFFVGLFLPSSLFQVPARQCSYLLTPFSSFSQALCILSTSHILCTDQIHFLCCHSCTASQRDATSGSPGRTGRASSNDQQLSTNVQTVWKRENWWWSLSIYGRRGGDLYTPVAGTRVSADLQQAAAGSSNICCNICFISSFWSIYCFHLRLQNCLL